MVQASVSCSRQRGTVRGIHFQRPPSCEAKLVRCIRGRLFDVIVDLRPGSQTYADHIAVELESARCDDPSAMQVTPTSTLKHSRPR